MVVSFSSSHRLMIEGVAVESIKRSSQGEWNLGDEPVIIIGKEKGVGEHENICN